MMLIANFMVSTSSWLYFAYYRGKPELTGTYGFFFFFSTNTIQIKVVEVAD